MSSSGNQNRSPRRDPRVRRVASQSLSGSGIGNHTTSKRTDYPERTRRSSRRRAGRLVTSPEVVIYKRCISLCHRTRNEKDLSARQRRESLSTCWSRARTPSVTSLGRRSFLLRNAIQFPSRTGVCPAISAYTLPPFTRAWSSRRRVSLLAVSSCSPEHFSTKHSSIYIRGTSSSSRPMRTS